jgi:hypothetical protein
MNNEMNEWKYIWEHYLDFIAITYITGSLKSPVFDEHTCLSFAWNLNRKVCLPFASGNSAHFGNCWYPVFCTLLCGEAGTLSSDKPIVLKLVCTMGQYHKVLLFSLCFSSFTTANTLTSQLLGKFLLLYSEGLTWV